MPTYLQPIIDARASEDYVEAHALLMQILEASADPNALLLLADNVLECCPEGHDPFALRKSAAETALAAFRADGDEGGEARALMTLATIIHDGCVELAKDALAIARKRGDKALMAHATCYLGNEASIAGRHEEAIQTVREGVRLAEESGDTELLADSLFVLGLAGEQQAFERMAELEGGYQRKRRFAHRLACAAGLIGEEKPSLAIDWYHRCLSIAREVSDPQLEGSVLRGLAQMERARGNVAKAEELEALGDVMCPLPDMTEIIKAAESGDMQWMDEAVRAAITKRN